MVTVKKYQVITTWQTTYIKTTYLSKAAEIFANAILGKIWIQTTYEYLTTDFNGTSCLRPLWVNHLVHERVSRLSKNLQICAINTNSSQIYKFGFEQLHN